MIEFRGVTKSFGGREVLRGLSFVVPEHTVFCILGASGTGKSVALKCLTGLLPLDAGEILFAGARISGFSEAAFRPLRRRLSLVFQLPALLDSRNLFENVTVGIRDRSFREKSAVCLRCLKAVQLEGFADDLLALTPASLSYGEQKRLAIARSLAVEPEWLLFDEPTTGLDPRMSEDIFRLVRNVATEHGKSVVVVSHDIQNALRFSDQILFLESGRVAAIGTPEELRKTTHPLVREFLAGSES